MIRSSKHILKYQTNIKTDWLDKLFADYKIELQYYIDLLWDKKLPLKKFLSTKDLTKEIIANSIFSGTWRQIVYKNTSEIIRSCIKKKKKSKPEVKSIAINLDARGFNIQKDSKEFDEFIRLTLPYWCNDRKTRYTTINIPIKHHKHSLRFINWNRKNTIKLTKINNNYYLIFIYEKATPKIKSKGKSLGIDQGYKKLLALSNGKIIGNNFETIYENIARKKQKSKNFLQALIERDNRINEIINKELKLRGINRIIIENLKNVKKNTKGKIRKKFNNKLQRWCYSKVVNKLERLCEENGIYLQKVNPAYTSQTCSSCGEIHKSSRNGELYTCISCKMKMDADINASINILHRGDYNPSTKEKLTIGGQ